MRVYRSGPILIPSMSESLPIDAFVSSIVSLVRERRALVVTAAPGAGKTTRVPPALVDDGPVILLQPRRMAARAIARRIAEERGWTIGREVGWHVRNDRRASRETRLLVATEGILTARLQQDPRLADFRTIVIDEFHERSVHADLGLALARRAWAARGDLRLVVMSATIDAARVAAFLGDCPVVAVPGRVHPLDVSYRPGVPPEQAIADVLPSARGAVLCFLPGAPEIRRTTDRLIATIGTSRAALLPLHGGLDADDQDAAIRPGAGLRVILATNLAETTITVPDVTVVIDSGEHKVARYDPARAIDSLETERISLDSADQRAGRAGRVQAGVVVRLWDARDRLRPHREPEIARVDLASTMLAVIASGGDLRTFDWFEAPPAHAVDAALALLRRLGAVDASGALTPEGRELQRLPLHPRLGRILVAAGGAPAAARACAILSERHFVPPRHGATSCDLLAAVDQDLPPHLLQVAREIREAVRAVTGRAPVDRIDDAEFRRAMFAGYPDRVARRRAPNGDRLVLASGTGARLARESGVHDAEFLVAVDVTAGAAGPRAEALVRLATRVEEDWLEPSSIDVEHAVDGEGVVRAVRRDRYDQLVLREHHVAPDAATAARLVAAEYVRRGPSDADAHLMHRLAFAGVEITFDALVGAASGGAMRIADVRLDAHVPADARRALDREAPATLTLPGGRTVRLDYRADGRAVVSTRLQDVFGMHETPRLGTRRVPVTFELLAPNGRPVQVTNDLASFWTRAYPEVKKALARRYPRHKW
jgi:ATP-dependent helicase HrpB